MKVIIETIPHKEQRYNTVGDWWFNNPPQTLHTELHIRVSKLGDTFMEQLIAFHEYAEAIMCANEGITEQEVTAFDERFEIMRSAFPDVVHKDSEPGNFKSAPYKRQHARATEIERSLCKFLGIDWKKYESVINNL